MVSDTCDAVGYADARQTVATKKCKVYDACDAVGYAVFCFSSGATNQNGLFFV